LLLAALDKERAINEIGIQAKPRIENSSCLVESLHKPAAGGAIGFIANYDDFVYLVAVDVSREAR
jgi:hypothetical protein